MTQAPTPPRETIRPVQRQQSAPAPKPRVSARHDLTPLDRPEDMVEMRITIFGHGKISTGDDHGFERYGAGEIVLMPETSAYQNFYKTWAEPVDFELAGRWATRKVNEEAMSQRAGKRRQDALLVGDEDVLNKEAWL